MAEETQTEGNGQSVRIEDLTWRDTEAFKRFVTDTGKILPRKYTRLTAKQQRHITRMIKRARSMLLMK